MFGEKFFNKSNINLEIYQIDGKDFIEFKGLRIEWVKKAYYRNINIKVYEDLGCVLTTGKNPPAKWIIDFLNAQYDWTLEALKSHSTKIQSLKEQKILPKPYLGGWVPYLGHPMKLVQVSKRKEEGVDVSAKEIRLYLEKDCLEDRLAKIYKKQAINYITRLQDKVSSDMGLSAKKLSFRNQKTRWGSCNSLGHISYNWRLMAAPGAWVEYVVVHETAHLKHMDHSKRFWSLVERHCPKYKLYSKGLKDKHAIFDFFNPESNLYKYKFNFINIA